MLLVSHGRRCAVGVGWRQTTALFSNQLLLHDGCAGNAGGKAMITPEHVSILLWFGLACCLLPRKRKVPDTCHAVLVCRPRRAPSPSKKMFAKWPSPATEETS